VLGRPGVLDGLCCWVTKRAVFAASQVQGCTACLQIGDGVSLLAGAGDSLLPLLLCAAHAQQAIAACKAPPPPEFTLNNALQSNSFEGPMPDFSSLPLLRICLLGRNKLNNTVPGEIRVLDAMNILDFSSNRQVLAGGLLPLEHNGYGD